MTKSDLGEVTSGSGIYQVLSPALKIGRLGATDKAGILYIGEAKNPQRRLKLLRRALLETDPERRRVEPRHVAAGRYRALPSHVIRAIPVDTLEFKVAACIDHKGAEEELLWEYFMKFGEVPPLNGTLKLYPKGTLRPSGA
ncbi:hypothetical protein [Pelagibius marinus]|uniref:hypothetical protein n=1 Tax=Pelagibius marinus TaxID=2762760 RepID=UPI00187333D9|nr:hypothetical protein [Pelagibius marinus]